jgi:cholesterol transport system auxiliary component
LLLRRFDASEAAADQRPAAVAAALDRAANRIAADVAGWAAGR